MRKGKSAGEAEGKLFLEKAQELMAKYNIDALPDEVDEKVNYKFHKEQINTEYNPHWSDDALQTIIARCFDVKIYRYTHASLAGKGYKVVRRRGWLLVGEELDIIVSKMAIDELRAALRAGAFKYINGHKVPNERKTAAAHAYCDGVVNGYIKHNAQGLRRAYDKVTKEQVDKYALVLVAKKDALAVFANVIEDTTPDRKRTDTSREGQAYWQGVQDGAQMDIAAGEGRLSSCFQKNHIWAMTWQCPAWHAMRSNTARLPHGFSVMNTMQGLWSVTWGT